MHSNVFVLANAAWQSIEKSRKKAKRLIMAAMSLVTSNVKLSAAALNND